MSLRKKLILVDIVCHGVSSPYIWRDYLSYLEKKYHGTITKVSFRDKQNYGWKAHKETFIINKHRITSVVFRNFFIKNIMMRQSCAKCYFANTVRPGDITIGDFWGWQKIDPLINADDKGVSLVLINTRKGYVLFDNIK